MMSDHLGPANPVLTPADYDWLREYFRDTYNEDWSADYQLELIGEVPDGVLRWADVERRVIRGVLRPRLEA